MSEFKIINAISPASVPSWGNKKQYLAIHYLGVVGQNHEPSSCACTDIWRLPRESNFQMRAIENLVFTGTERFIRDAPTMRLSGIS